MVKAYLKRYIIIYMAVHLPRNTEKGESSLRFLQESQRKVSRMKSVEYTHCYSNGVITRYKTNVRTLYF